jgi:hypothetical protein
LEVNPSNVILEYHGIQEAKKMYEQEEKAIILRSY